MLNTVMSRHSQYEVLAMKAVAQMSSVPEGANLPDIHQRTDYYHELTASDAFAPMQACERMTAAHLSADDARPHRL